MGKGVYVGDESSKARKVKKLYYGVENLAREVKKGYIGIGGVARPFWTGEPGFPVYYGEIAPLSVARTNLGAEAVGDYVLFAGGWNTIPYRPTRYSTVDAYNSSLSKVSVSNLSFSSYVDKSETFNNKAIFSQGEGSALNTYDQNLTRSNYTSFSSTIYRYGISKNNQYLIVAGGASGDLEYAYSTANAFNASFTRIAAPNISSERYDISLNASVGDFAIFAGGTGDHNDSHRGNYLNADAYNSSLTRTTATPLPGTYQNSFARILRGENITGYTLLGSGNFVLCAYDPSLTLITLSNHGTDGMDMGVSMTLNNYYAMYGLGNFFQEYSKSFTVYDASLTLRPDISASSPRTQAAGTSFLSTGYALVGGGSYYDPNSQQTTNFTSVEAYKSM